VSMTYYCSPQSCSQAWLLLLLICFIALVSWC
jgi:cbb3-type cytochrome oxidase subunit 3